METSTSVAVYHLSKYPGLPPSHLRSLTSLRVLNQGTSDTDTGKDILDDQSIIFSRKSFRRRERESERAREMATKMKMKMTMILFQLIIIIIIIMISLVACGRVDGTPVAGTDATLAEDVLIHVGNGTSRIGAPDSGDLCAGAGVRKKNLKSQRWVHIWC